MSADLRLFEDDYKYHTVLETHQYDNDFDSRSFYGTKIAEVRINQVGDNEEVNAWLFKYTFYRVCNSSTSINGKGFFLIQRSTFEGVRTLSAYEDQQYNRMLSDNYNDIGRNLYGMDLIDLEDALITHMTESDLTLTNPDELYDKTDWKYDKYTGELLENPIS